MHGDSIGLDAVEREDDINLTGDATRKRTFHGLIEARTRRQRGEVGSLDLEEAEALREQLAESGIRGFVVEVEKD